LEKNLSLDNFIHGTHSCTDKERKDWRIFKNTNSIIKLIDLIPIIAGREAILVKHTDIAWKAEGLTRVINRERYDSCNINFPGILAENTLNPDNRRYRMVDGSHRLNKKILEYDMTESLFYIITKEEFYSVLRDYKTGKKYESDFIKQNLYAS